MPIRSGEYRCGIVDGPGEQGPDHRIDTGGGDLPRGGRRAVGGIRDDEFDVVATDVEECQGCGIEKAAALACVLPGKRDQESDQEARHQQDVNRARGTYEVSASLKPVIGMMNGLAYGGAAVLSSSLDMRIGCERTSFRFLAAAYGRINSTWTLPNQVGWPIAKELLFTGRVVEAEEAYRIGLLNHLVPAEQLREKTMEIGTAIAKNRRESVMGIKELLLQHMGCNLEQMWANERDFTTNRVRGYNAEQAFPEFIARKGR